MKKIGNRCNYIIENCINRKGTRHLLLSILFLSLFVLNTKAFAQSTNWSASAEPQKVFIENKGQFHIHNSDEKVLFAFDGGANCIYFTKKGVSYSYLKRWAKEKDKEELEREEKFSSPEEYKEKEAEERRMEYESDAIMMTWEGANPNVEIAAFDVTSDYHSYSYKDKDGSEKNINYIKAYKKIVYKNLYPNIDVEYVFHPLDGIKYSLILHPGADISQVKMRYSDMPRITAEGDVHIKTKFGDIIDHAPTTFYSDDTFNKIASHFVRNANTIAFSLDTYDHTKSVTIDPWTQGPTLPASNGVWECEIDGAGNVYIIGGEMPMKLLKYNSTGVIQWTYNTPYDTANYWLGTFATDMAGNSYVTSGSIAGMKKVNAAGAVVWTWNAPLLSVDEYWNIAFNCDQTKLIVGGTSGTMLSIHGAIFYINTANGAVLSNQTVALGSMFGIPPSIQEVRSITACRNARYYYLTLDTLGAIDDDFSQCGSTSPIIFKMDHGLHFSYKSEDYKPNNGNSGMMCIRANRYFVYTQNGATLQKRSLLDGSVIASVAIPGGINTTSLFGQHQAGNAGIDIDSCGNVYVGSATGVYKFDANLVPISNVATPYRVFDVAVSTNGDVVFCGATGTSATATNRNGKIQSANMSACPPMTLFCCDVTVCPVNPICDSMPAFNLIVSQAGGVFSGQGIIDASLGTFDPMTAGPGTHTISYTLSCGTGTIVIDVVNCGAPCPTLTFNNTSTPACIGSLSGSVTVEATNGSSPYVYILQDSTGATIATYVNMVGSQPIYGLAPGQYVVVVMDANNCVGTDTITVGITSNLTPTITGPSTICAGTTATLDAGVYATYLWSTSDVTQTLLITAAGTYFVTVTDAGGCTGTDSITVTLGNSLSPVITGQLNICPGTTTTLNAGNGYANYLWSNSANTQTITVNTSGTYSVTVSNVGGCSGSAAVTVVVYQTLPISVTAQPQTVCPGNPVTLAVTGGQSYVWNTVPPSTDSVFIVNPTVNTTYMVTATYNGCTGTAQVTVNVDSYLSVSTSSTNASCASNDGTATANASGPGYTYVWNTVPPQYTQTATGLADGNYSVTVTLNGCSGVSTAIVVRDAGPLAAFFAQPDQMTIGDGPIFFFDQSVGTITQWNWTYGDNSSGTGNHTSHIYADTGSYLVILIVTDAGGCLDTAQGYININPYFALWIPNCFTPNNDEKNPVFKPIGVGIDSKSYFMTVYDRWGREMFYTTDINEGWNGTLSNKYDYSKAVQGVYVYLVRVTDVNGRKHIYKGIVTLVQ